MAQTNGIRFAVGTADGPQASVWRVWFNGDDVYAASRNGAQIEKLSFHHSGICRKAFTSEYGTPRSLQDRATLKWRRMPTPAAGDGKGSRVLSLAFPTDFLSAPKPIEKAVTWIAPASVGRATIVDMIFTNDDFNFVARELEKSGVRKLVHFEPLPGGENFVVCANNEQWENWSVLMPASHGAKSAIMFSDYDPAGTGRPIRLSQYKNPKDGDALLMQELGGFKIAEDALRAFGRPYRTLIRDQVIAHGGDEMPF